MGRFVYAYPDVPHPLQLAGAQTIATAPDSAQSWLPASPYRGSWSIGAIMTIISLLFHYCGNPCKRFGRLVNLPRNFPRLECCRGLRALSHITENRKVEAPKSLIFRDPIFGFCLQKATLRQSCHVPWGHPETCKWEPRARNLQGSPFISCFIGLASCGSIGSRIVNSLWLIAVGPHRGGSISLRPGAPTNCYQLSEVG